MTKGQAYIGVFVCFIFAIVFVVLGWNTENFNFTILAALAVVAEYFFIWRANHDN